MSSDQTQIRADLYAMKGAVGSDSQFKAWSRRLEQEINYYNSIEKEDVDNDFSYDCGGKFRCKLMLGQLLNAM